MRRFLGLLAGFVAGCLVVSPAHAQIGNWQAREFFNLVGGLNNSTDPTSIAPNEASDLQNVTFSVSGGIEKRPGFARINSSAACGTQAFTGQFMYR